MGDNIERDGVGGATLQDKASCAHQMADEHGLGKEWLQLKLVRTSHLWKLYWGDSAGGWEGPKGFC